MRTSGYPSHGFVIDRTEAKDLFNGILEPNDIEREIGSFFKWLSDKVEEEDNGPRIIFLSNPPKQPESQTTEDMNVETLSETNIVNIKNAQDE